MTVFRGHFSVCEQIGQRGFFGRVSLDVSPDSATNEFVLQFDRNCDKTWQSGAQFGIEYVFARLPKSHFPDGLKVVVSRIEGQAVDTSNALIAYAAANALIDVLGNQTPPIERPTLNTDLGVITFPAS